ncbi:hypothetical protein DVH05_012627 [Phytophthora capsici]|nr:hypothetical protein DVH05_018593 [Phytophthora capsici]KAG1699736.1 hypothetical protein DVH05_012627 [Phytophthora capsici]
MAKKPNSDSVVGRSGHGVKVKATIATRAAQVPTEPARLVGAEAGARSTINRQPVDTGRLTPYEQLRQRLATEGNSRRVTRVEDLKSILTKNADPAERLTMRMKLLWISQHTFKQFNLVKLHFVDEDSPEPLQTLLELFRDTYVQNQETIDTILLTATMWDIDSDSDDLPRSGQIVNINSYSKLQIFQEDRCQLTVKLRDLSWENNQP